ncbi:hypothetical protein LXA43DRAFT_879401 [Ganoderma leucocontextum]|nr:hypothetical protein LXA43DRAFT_879401 [Ganoderma leucocontextum]
MTDPLLSSVLRLRTKAKNVAKTQVRNPYRRRKKAIKLTQDERRAKQAIRDTKKIKLNSALTEARETVMGLAEDLAQQFPPHDKVYYYRLIMQLPAKKSHRAISQWCAYLSIRMETHNNGAPRDRVTKDAVLQQISEEWKALSPEQKHALTADKVKELEERRENRVEAVHNTNISACHDARVTLKNIQTELENLHKRTGMGTLLLATRGSIEAFGNPVVHYSDPRVQQFMETTVGATLEDTALRLEGYCISGVQGMSCSTAACYCHDLIIGIGVDTVRRAKRGEIKRMNYINFADAITVKYGIVAENWTTKFESTSGLSHMEVEIALRAWESGTTRFRALTDEEWRGWLEARTRRPLQQVPPTRACKQPQAPARTRCPRSALPPTLSPLHRLPSASTPGPYPSASSIPRPPPPEWPSLSPKPIARNVPTLVSHEARA